MEIIDSQNATYKFIDPLFLISIKMEEICEHTLDTSIIRDGANILDAGCRDFLFTNAMKLRFKANVISLDIDDLGPSAEPYMRAGLAFRNGTCSVSKNSDPQARQITFGTEIPVYDIETLSRKVGISIWDVIKLDIEGAEFFILNGLTAAPARQISVEFHQHTSPRTIDEMNGLFRNMRNLGYEIQHNPYDFRFGAGFNWWDCLFVYTGPESKLGISLK